jgi:hypothetical protein
VLSEEEEQALAEARQAVVGRTGHN